MNLSDTTMTPKSASDWWDTRQRRTILLARMRAVLQGSQSMTADEYIRLLEALHDA